MNMNLSTIKFTFAEEEIKSLANFVLALNSRLSSASMFCPNRIEPLLTELAESAAYGFLAVSTEGSGFVAACWVYYNYERQTADVNLFVSDEFCCDFDEYASAVFFAVRKKLPPQTQYNFYFPKQNQALFSYLTKIGAARNVDEFGLLLRREDVCSLGDTSGVTELSPDDYAQFAALHDEIFPDIYISGKGILDSVGARRKVFVLKESGVLTAYSVLESKSENRLCAEIIGVKEGYRHYGRGKTVLRHLLKEAFANPVVQSVDLIVDSDNENALKLYFDTGFAVEFENRSFTFCEAEAMPK